MRAFLLCNGSFFLIYPGLANPELFMEPSRSTGALVLVVQCRAIQCSEVQYSVVQCRALQCNDVQCSVVQCSAMQCSIV